MFQTLWTCRTKALAVLAKLTWLPPTLARLTLGLVFFNSGRGKLGNLPQVVEYFQSLGIPAPHFQAPLAAGAELVCGALLLLGLFSRLASVPLVVTMIVALLTAKKDEIEHLSSLFTMIEYLYIVMLVWIGVSGPGPLALDRFLGRGKSA
jgi:putative oxidoreductase